MKKVLVVDDEVYIRGIIKNYLESNFHCETETASNVDEALEVIKDRSIDLIFLDINMPGTDSLYLVETMKNDPEHQGIPIVVLSAMNFDHLRDTFTKKGVNYFFSKMSLIQEAERQQLSETLSAILDRKE